MKQLDDDKTSPPPWGFNNYTHSYKELSFLCLETGYFGLKFHRQDLTKVLFSTFPALDKNTTTNTNTNTGISYQDAISKSNRYRMDHMNSNNDATLLQEEELILQIIVVNDDGRQVVYRAKEYDVHSPRLWESGKIVQHYDFLNLIFSSNTLNDDATTVVDHHTLVGCTATLSVVVWSTSITFTLQVDFPPIPTTTENTNHDGTKKFNNEYSTSSLQEFQIQINFKDWKVERTFHRPQSSSSTTNQKQGEKYTVSLSCNIHPVGEPSIYHPPNTITTTSEKANEDEIKLQCTLLGKKPQNPLIQTNFSNEFNCYLLSKPGGAWIRRDFPTDYTDIRDYDEFKIQIQIHKSFYSSSTAAEPIYIPILLFVQLLANPTGCCPILCDENFYPTGIPVQLSKNWHYKPMYNYGRFYFYLPLIKKKKNSNELKNDDDDAEWTTITYYLRIVYGFYGNLPSASHSNLSLVGYGQNCGRWEQLAIGCWGETYCMDMDMSCVSRTVTDVRMLMTKGEENKKWHWSDAGWGGDWTKVCKGGKRLLPCGWKTAYMSHGPCLTDVYYDGWYGNQKEISLSANVQTLRTDDYARTFTSLSLEFNECLPASDAYFFMMGGGAYIETTKVAYGNAEGLIEEVDVPTSLKEGEYFMKCKELYGPGPWFVGFPGQMQRNGRKWGKGWRALIIRKIEGTLQGHIVKNPFFSFIATRKEKHIEGANVSFLLSPPSPKDNFLVGDKISYSVEWITLPKQEEDYYGPNVIFKDQLRSKQPWEILYREAIENHSLITELSGGILLRNYPVMIEKDKTDQNIINFKLGSGAGAVPIQFVGLVSPYYSLWKIDGKNMTKYAPECHGNDYMEIQYDTRSQTFNQVYNIPLDGAHESHWRLLL